MQLFLTLLVAFCSVSFAMGEQPEDQIPTCPPEQLGLDANHLQRIDGLVQQEIEKKNIPGCVVMIGRQGAIGFAKAYGNRQLQPETQPMTLDTVFDLASLTKPIATATSIMILVERGVVRLREPAADYIPEFGQNGKEEITIEQLLTHQAGLIPDNPLADYEEGIEKAWQNLWQLKPTDALGNRFVYTDVGFMVLGEVVQRMTGQNVAQFAKENIYQPLAMHDSGYLPGESLAPRAAPTEQREGRWMRGEVHDPRAYLLGGVAGHAGLFSTAHDLARYANMLLGNGALGKVQILSRQTLKEMTRPRNIAGQLRGLGWDMGSKYSSNRGEFFSSQSFGHGGFTGTAFWVDPELDLFVIFLSNRVHPDGKGSANPLAGRIATIASASIQRANPHNTTLSTEGAPASASKPPVLCGIDVLQRDNYQALSGRRVGLITNHTGLNRQGSLTVDLLHAAPQVTLTAIFSPEHGLRGKLDQPNIDNTRDEATGLPVFSLYGKSRQPSAAQFENIDTLVFDIQDIGARFYTFVSTMGLAMEAAAQHGLRFVVLDRPNPIGGTIVEGPLLDAGKESFVGFHTIPVRHGMTAGELARIFRQERGWNLDLQVIELENWRRADYWDATGLTWINPSPNMRSLTQAVLYPGIGLLETTNLSVGRGTDTPFEIVGAPWIDANQLAAMLNQASLAGVRFVPVRFTPDQSKFAGELCHGINVIVVNRNSFRSVPVGLEIARSLRRLHPDQWDTSNFNRLLCNDEVYENIRTAADLPSLDASIKRQAEQFLLRRSPYLIYP
ncbi:MAG: DUF1343 domain-containing protein [Planctomycetales bacterium]|nr:DUF1343 domain-containing protein [Planctomycetales bacterium]